LKSITYDKKSIVLLPRISAVGSAILLRHDEGASVVPVDRGQCMGESVLPTDDRLDLR
jgi:hypothetical protein